MDLLMKKSKQSKKNNVNNMKKLSSRIKEATYENIFVDCPYCHKECIFNRVSDLDTIMPISGKDLECEYCKKIFWALSDRATSAKYRWFLDDLPLLKRNKRYGLYIFALCQSCEIFMHQAIINKLIDTNPVYRDSEGYFCGKNKAGADTYNEIYEEFCNKKFNGITNNGLKDKTQYKKSAFDKLRKLFLHIFDDARKNELPTLKKLKEDRREKCFCVIENTDINKTRNDIAHKDAYRPSFCDVQKYDELIDSLYWLGTYLGVKDSLFYVNQRICRQRKT
jgi:hypothetical protein